MGQSGFTKVSSYIGLENRKYDSFDNYTIARLVAESDTWLASIDQSCLDAKNPGSTSSDLEKLIEFENSGHVKKMLHLIVFINKTFSYLIKQPSLYELYLA